MSKRVFLFVSGLMTVVALTAVYLLISQPSPQPTKIWQLEAQRVPTKVIPLTPTPTDVAPPLARLELPETAPEDVEERPFMIVKLEIMDGQTEQPIKASVHFAVRNYGEAEYINSRRDVCGYVSVCRLQVPANDKVIYKIEVERQGYKLWAVEMRTRSLSTRTMIVPVRLVRVGREA